MAIILKQSVDRSKNLEMKIRTRHVRIKIDFSRIHDNKLRAHKYLNAVVIRDSNPYCPILTGNLRASALEHSNLDTGPVVWQTSYAKKQYYTHKTKPKWFETAKAVNYPKWEKGVKTIIGKR